MAVAALRPPPRSRPLPTPRRKVSRPAGWEWLTLLLILLGGTVLRGFWEFFALDDSFITYTYARSIAEGDGFAFGGAKALGTTTPLYALLLALPLRLGAPVHLTGQLIGSFCAVASCVLLFLLARPALGPWGGLASAALLAGNARFTAVSMSGMETALYTAVCLAALVAFLYRRATLTALLCAVVILVRPDGVLLALAIGAVHLLMRRRVYPGPLVVFALPLVAWGLYAWSQFGSPIPSSLTAKLAYPEYGQFRLDTLLRFAVADAGPYVAVAAIVGALYALLGAQTLLPLALWTGLYVAAFTRAPNFVWYYVPALPGLLTLAVAGVAGVFHFSRADLRLRAPGWTVLRAGLGIAALAALAPVLAAEFRDYRALVRRTYGVNVTQAYRSVGEWLHDHTPPGSLVAAPEVGYVGYFSRRRVLDLAGLCSPEVIPYLRRRDYDGIIRDFRPDYVALTTEGNRPIHNAISRSPWFRAHYRPRQRFPYRSGRDYVLYELAAPPRPVEDASTRLTRPLGGGIPKARPLCFSGPRG